MNKISDLNIEKEILPLFDYSLNMFSRNKILEILEKPLDTTNEIIHRQNILKGFSENEEILKDYSYTILYLKEVHAFLNDEKIDELSKKKLKYKLFASRQEKTKYTSKLNQLVLFFFRLESKYLVRLKLEAFPKEYASKIKQILQFLSSFELHKFAYIIREKGLKDKHVIELTERINELKRNDWIRPFWEEFFLFEAYLSISFGITKNNFSFPCFTKDKIMLQNFYHPLIENPVKNNFETNSNVFVLNGPNMSGKSTFLKAVSLCMYFGHLGIGIPASKGEIPFCDCFLIEINRRDDILKGYSHFMTEVMNLKRAVELATNGKKCFVVFDELFSGTNVEDSFEICKITINGLSKFNMSYFFISTHIQELKNVSNERIENYYIACELIENIPTFTYQLKRGWSDIKLGRILFEKEGLNKMLS